MIVWNLEERRQLETLRGHTRRRHRPARSARTAARSTPPASRATPSPGTCPAPAVSARGSPPGFVAIPQDAFPPAFSISPDGRELAVARLDGKVDLIDAQTLRTRRTFRAFDRVGRRTAIDYSPDGARLAVAGARGLIGLFDARAGSASARSCTHPAGRARIRPLWTDRCYEETIQALAFAERGLLATASIGGAVRIWDLERRRSIRPPLRAAEVRDRPRRQPGRLAARGHRSASSTPTNGVEILDVRSGRRLARLATGGEPSRRRRSPRTADLLAHRADQWHRGALEDRRLAPVGSPAQARRAPSSGFASRPTGGPWRRPAATGRSRCGTSALASRSAPRCRASRTAVLLPAAAPERWVTARFTRGRLAPVRRLRQRLRRSAGSSTRPRGGGTRARSRAAGSLGASGKTPCRSRTTARAARRSRSAEIRSPQ